jgi:tetratricopeptide (TPR) repeat protein
MNYSVFDILNKVGRPDLLREINVGVIKYYEDHPPDTNDLEAMRTKAFAMIQDIDLLRSEGQLAKIVPESREALRIFLQLGAIKPDNLDYQREISLGYERVGDVLRDQGDVTGALKNYYEGFAIAEKLAKQHRDNADLQRDLSVSHGRVGDVQSAQGDLAGARKSYQDCFAIAEKLAKQDPRNAGWQRDLSASYIRVGDVQSAQRDLAGALKSYQDSLAIAEKLSKQDPGNAVWLSDLSVSYIRVGDVQRARGVSYIRVGDVQRAGGDLAEARKSCQDGLAIAEKLSKQDPGNAGWQRYLSLSPDNADWQGDLAYSCWRTGATLAAAEPKSNIQAREMVEKGRDILRQLKQRTGLTAQQQKWLDAIEGDLQEMQKDKLQSQTPRK